MTNYPIQQRELPAVRAICTLHNLKYTTSPGLRPGVVWLSIYHPDPTVQLSNELCFALGRSLELQVELMERDERATAPVENQLELIVDLP